MDALFEDRIVRVPELATEQRWPEFVPRVAALAGTWIAAVAGFGGMRDHDGFLSFAPRLPARLERLSFRLRFRGRQLMVEATKQEATYTLLEGRPLDLSHHGDQIKVSKRKPVIQPIPPIVPDRPPPSQPPGRKPLRRGVDGTKES